MGKERRRVKVWPAPVGGLHEGKAEADQPEGTTNDTLNVVPNDPADDRARISQRSGTSKHVPTTINASNPIQDINFVRESTATPSEPPEPSVAPPSSDGPPSSAGASPGPDPSPGPPSSSSGPSSSQPSSSQPSSSQPSSSALSSFSLPSSRSVCPPDPDCAACAGTYLITAGCISTGSVTITQAPGPLCYWEGTDADDRVWTLQCFDAALGWRIVCVLDADGDAYDAVHRSTCPPTIYYTRTVGSGLACSSGVVLLS